MAKLRWLDRIAFHRNGRLRFGSKSLIVGVAVGLLATVLLAFGLTELPRQQREAADWVAHTLQVLEAATTLEADLSTTASEGRAFLTDKSETSRTRFDVAANRTNDDLTPLRALTIDNPAQQTAIDRVTPVIAARIALLRDLMNRIAADDMQGAAPIVQSNRGRYLNDEIVARIDAIKAHEQRLLADRGQVARHAATRTLVGLLTCGSAMAASLFFTLALILGRRRERKYVDELHKANAELEQRVQARTAAIAASETRLRASEANYRLLSEHASDMVSRVGPDGVRQYVSPACAHIFGTTADNLLGGGLREQLVPEDRPALDAFCQALITGSVEEHSVTYRVLNPERGTVWVEGTARLVRDSVTGAPDGYVAISRDVTERRRLEAERQAGTDELRRVNFKLERMTRHLMRARDKAELASQAKSRFLAGISHELRTPLNGILGYSQLLKLEGDLNPVQARRVEAMLDAGRHLLEMINRVLDLSEVEADRIEFRPSEVDLDQIAHACLNFVRPMAKAKGLALRVGGLPRPDIGLTTDPIRLRQVLVNLLGNAIKFTPRGGVEMRLRPDLHRGTLRIDVVDTGPGIPSELRLRLFQSFDRLGAESTVVEGAGLGLALSARLAAVLGGRLGHDDNPGGGSIFWLELPLKPAAAPKAPEPEPGLGVCDAAPSSAHHGALQVLVVDDVLMNRDIAGSLLRTAGHAVTYAEGGAEAVAAAEASEFDVILMDVRMPGMDGLEAARRIRAFAGSRRHVPIIALTAQAFAEQVAECRAAGMDSHLPKPFDPEELLACVTRAAAFRKAREQKAATPSAVPGTFDAPPLKQGVGTDDVDLAAFQRTAAYLKPDATATYLRTVAQRAEALLLELQQPGALAGPNRALSLAAHTLAGSAGMFGFKRLALAGREFELAIEADTIGKQAVADELAAAIKAVLEQMPNRLQNIAERAASSARIAEPTLAVASISECQPYTVF